MNMIKAMICLRTDKMNQQLKEVLQLLWKTLVQLLAAPRDPTVSCDFYKHCTPLYIPTYPHT